MTERVLFFAPHAGIWQHAFPEALIADAVRNVGGEVIYITCGGALSSYCVTMASRGLRAGAPAPERMKVCATCRRNRTIIRDGIGFAGYDFDSVLTPADDDHIRELLRTARRDDVTAFVVDGIEVGRAALYEFLIHHKRSRVVFDEAEWAVFLPHLGNVLRSFLAAQRILDRERPTRIVAYNTLYSVNAVWRALADARGIPMFGLHAGPSLARRLATMNIVRDSTIRNFYRLIDLWPEQSALPCTREELVGVTDHFIEVMKGTNVFAYSTAKQQGEADWRERYGIRPGQKLLVATMSSYDEYTAASSVGEQPGSATLLFPTQIEWVRALIESVRGNPERFLLIRVHPREFPNKREGTKSEHAHALERALVELPDNVRVNWPADNLSLYAIAEHADVFLNAWSSVGKEMGLFGRPVVVYCPTLLMYSPAINYVGETHATYFAAIETALRDGWSFEHIRTAYRWCAIEYVRSIAEIGDGFEFSEARATTFLQRVRNALLAIPNVRQVRDLLRKPPELIEQARLAAIILTGGTSLLEFPAEPRAHVTEADETAMLRHELGRLVAVMYSGARGAPVPGTLRHYLTSAAS